MDDSDEDLALDERYQLLRKKHADIVFPKVPRHSPGTPEEAGSSEPMSSSSYHDTPESEVALRTLNTNDSDRAASQILANDSSDAPELNDNDGDDDPNDPLLGTLNDSYTAIFSETAIRARQEEVQKIGSSIEIPPWKNLNKAPKPPVFPRPVGKCATICVGFLDANLRVRQQRSEDPNRSWISMPTVDEAKKNRRKGDAVWLRMISNQPFAPSWSFVDDGGRFVHLDTVSLKEAFRGDNQAAALRKAEHEVARLYYLEYEQRIAAFERNVAIYLERARLFIAWAPPVEAEIDEVKNKDEAKTELLAELRKTNGEYHEWDLGRLSTDFQRSLEAHRHELALKCRTMVDNRIEDAEKLNSDIANMPSIEYCYSEVFENNMKEWNKARTGQIRDQYRVKGDRAKCAAKLRKVITRAMTDNSFQGHVVSGVGLMELSALRGWNKETLIRKWPNIAIRCKHVWW